jgi:hypothetical protein
MAEQAFLVKIRPEFTVRVTSALQAELRQGGVQVLPVAERTFIVRMDAAHRDALAARVEVALVGGVELHPRAVRRIRVDAAGCVLGVVR